MSRSDELPDLPAAVTARVDQMEAFIRESYGGLLDCDRVRQRGVPCEYHRGVWRAIHDLSECVGESLLQSKQETEEATGHPLCEGARLLIGEVGAWHVAWLQVTEHLAP